MNDSEPNMWAIIVTFESQALIAECLRSAIASGVENIVIWDNSFSSETSSVVEALQLPNVRLLSDRTNHGFGGGINRALETVPSGSSVLLLNPDCMMTPECLRSMRANLAMDQVGIVAPRMKYADGRNGIAGGPRPSLWKELLAATRIDNLLSPRVRQVALATYGRFGRGAGYAESLTSGPPVDMFWVSGFCSMISVNTLEAVGRMDESFFLYFEDVDLSIRVRALGLRVLLDRRVEALHFESASTSLVGKSKSYRDGRRVFFRKHGNRAERIAMWMGF